MDKKNIDELSEFLSKNGFSITDSLSFHRNLKDNDINNFINSLVTTKNSSFDFDFISFAKSFNEKINVISNLSNQLGNLEIPSVIDNILNNDETIKFGDPNKLKDFKTAINDIKAKFTDINEYLIAKKDMVNKRSLFIRATKEIYDIENNDSLSIQEKTNKTLTALQYKNLYKNEYFNVLKVFREKEKALNGYNISNFRNDILNDLNTLDSTYPTLPFSDENKNNLKTTINELRNLTILYDSKTISSNSELDKLCSRYGITYDEEKDIYKSTIISKRLNNSSQDIKADKDIEAVKYDESNEVINNKVFNKLSNNGIFISSPKDFAKSIGSKSIEEFTQNLVSLKNSSNFFDFLSFSKEFDKKIGVLTNISLETSNIDKKDTIDTLFNNDETVAYGNPEILKRFNNALENIKKRFSSISQINILEQNMLRAKSELNKAKSDLLKLSKDSSLSQGERTKKALLLTNLIQECKKTYDEASKTYYEQREILKNINVNEFKNGLNNDLNILYSSYVSLPFTLENKEKIKQNLDELKKLVFTYDLSAIKAKSELEKMCNIYGLTYDEAKDLNKTMNSLNTSNNLDEIESLSENSPSKPSGPNNPTQPENKPIELGEAKIPDESKNNQPKSNGSTNPTDSENKPIELGEATKLDESQKKQSDTSEAQKQNNSENQSKEPNESQKANDEEFEKLINELSKQEETGPKIKVVAKKAWTWTKNHKKQILIAIGISLLIVTAIIALQGILPSIPALTQASNISTTCSCMLNNASLMNGVAAAQHASLQGANTILASTLQNLTGSSVVLNSAGTWSVGGQSLATFAAKAAADYNAILAPIIKMGNAATILGLGGVASIAGGLLLNKKSSGFKNINNRLNSIFDSIDTLKRNDTYLKCKEILLLTKQSPTMSEAEKEIIIKKVKKCLKEADEKELKKAKPEQLNATNTPDTENLYEESKGGR